MTVDQLIFVGLNGYAAALDRDTGGIVWSNNPMKGYGAGAPTSLASVRRASGQSVIHQAAKVSSDAAASGAT